MSALPFYPEAKLKRLPIDARTKLLVLVVCNVLIMGFNSRLTLWPIITCVGVALAFDMSWKFFLSYWAGLLLCQAILLLPGFWESWISITLGTSAYWILRFGVSLVLGIWMFSTTRISEFTTAFYQLRFPKVLIIPLSVMFRFFPVVIGEFRGILEAIKLRGYQGAALWLHPIRTSEYIVVPLLSAVARIADELAAAALIRGLGTSGRPTQLVNRSFGWLDGVTIALLLGFIAIAMIGKLQ